MPLTHPVLNVGTGPDTGTGDNLRAGGVLLNQALQTLDADAAAAAAAAAAAQGAANDAAAAASAAQMTALTAASNASNAQSRLVPLERAELETETIQVSGSGVTATGQFAHIRLVPNTPNPSSGILRLPDGVFLVSNGSGVEVNVRAASAPSTPGVMMSGQVGGPNLISALFEVKNGTVRHVTEVHDNLFVQTETILANEYGSVATGRFAHIRVVPDTPNPSSGILRLPDGVFLVSNGSGVAVDVRAASAPSTPGVVLSGQAGGPNPMSALFEVKNDTVRRVTEINNESLSANLFLETEIIPASDDGVAATGRFAHIRVVPNTPNPFSGNLFLPDGVFLVSNGSGVDVSVNPASTPWMHGAWLSGSVDGPYPMSALFEVKNDTVRRVTGVNENLAVETEIIPAFDYGETATGRFAHIRVVPNTPNPSSGILRLPDGVFLVSNGSGVEVDVRAASAPSTPGMLLSGRVGEPYPMSSLFEVKNGTVRQVTEVLANLSEDISQFSSSRSLIRWSGTEPNLSDILRALPNINAFASASYINPLPFALVEGGATTNVLVPTSLNDSNFYVLHVYPQNGSTLPGGETPSPAISGTPIVNLHGINGVSDPFKGSVLVVNLCGSNIAVLNANNNGPHVAVPAGASALVRSNGRERVLWCEGDAAFPAGDKFFSIDNLPAPTDVPIPLTATDEANAYLLNATGIVVLRSNTSNYYNENPDTLWVDVSNVANGMGALVFNRRAYGFIRIIGLVGQTDDFVLYPGRCLYIPPFSQSFKAVEHTHTASEVSGLSNVATTGSYTDLINVPTAFPPSAHGHAAADITGLATVAITGAYSNLSGRPAVATSRANSSTDLSVEDWHAVSFGQSVFDDIGLIWTDANRTFAFPSGITRAKLSCSVFASAVSPNLEVAFSKNAAGLSGTPAWATFDGNGLLIGSRLMQVSTGWLSVNSGDVFRVIARRAGSGNISILSSDRTWLTVEAY